jgi:RNA polymerase sigma-32 factor
VTAPKNKTKGKSKPPAISGESAQVARPPKPPPATKGKPDAPEVGEARTAGTPEVSATAVGAAGEAPSAAVADMVSAPPAPSTASPRRTTRAAAPAKRHSRSQSGSRSRDEEESGEQSEAGDSDGAESAAGDAEDIDDDIVEAAAEVVSDGDSNYGARAPRGSSQQSGSLARLDPMQQYLREVQRHSLLTPDEEHSLAVKYSTSADVAAAARLVTANLRLVVKIAYEYRRAYKNIMDLVQEGNIGLMQAVKRYDPYRGVKLSSYAAWWIRAYILRFILNNWRLVKLGTTQAQRKLFFNLNKEKARLSAMGIEPSAAEIARRLGVEENEVSDMDRRLSAGEMSLDAPVGDSEGRAVSRLEMLPTSVSGPDAVVAEGEMQQIVKEKLADFRTTLKGKDIQIFDERLVAEEPLTLQELGDKFGISRERVRQLEARLTGKLREFLKNELGDAVAS